MKNLQTAAPEIGAPILDFAPRQSRWTNKSTFVLHRLLADDRLVIVAADQLYPNDPEGIKLPPSVLLKSTTARCWLEAKEKLGFPLTALQSVMFDERYQLVA